MSLVPITMRCPDCGLQWTMTVHQIARAAQHWSLGGPDEVAAMLDSFAAWMGE